MFFLKHLERSITLHPSFFGQNTNTYIKNKLYADVEGTIHGNAYIIMVVNIEEDDFEGRCVPGSGVAEYLVKYRAVVWRPYRNEVVDGKVSEVIPTGFFVEVGPLTVFVARSMIPPELVYDAHATPPHFTNNNDQVIDKGCQVRLKIFGVRTEVAHMFALGNIRDHFLGPIGLSTG